jgi:hypothetical protein
MLRDLSAFLLKTYCNMIFLEIWLLHYIGELGKNLSPSKLRKCQDSKEFMKACREDPSESVIFMISKTKSLIL